MALAWQDQRPPGNEFQHQTWFLLLIHKNTDCSKMLQSVFLNHCIPTMQDIGICRLFFRSEHRIPCRELDRLLVKHLEYVCWNVLLLDYEAEHVLVEPLVSHDVVALIS